MESRRPGSAAERSEQESAEPVSLEARFINAAEMVLAGELAGIKVREGENGLKLFNAEQGLMYEGYEPEQEFLKGLICAETPEGLKVVCPCFPKFYNLGEKPNVDQRFFELVRSADSVMHLPEKIDGTNIRIYLDPVTGEIKAATRGMMDGGKDSGDEEPGETQYINFGQESLKIAQEQFPRLLEKEVLERYTPVAELIHPQNRIITDYGDRRDLVLLSVFDKANGCRELTRDELVEFAKKYDAHLVDTIKVESANWEDAMAELQQQWEGTDREGTVVTIEQQGEVVFRVKVKSKDYLALMRAMKFCTLSRTQEFVTELQAVSWDDFKAKIHEKFLDLPEEVMMGYEDNYRTVEAYNAEITGQADKIFDYYRSHIQEWREAMENKTRAAATAETESLDQEAEAIMQKYQEQLAMGEDAKSFFHHTNIVREKELLRKIYKKCKLGDNDPMTLIKEHLISFRNRMASSDKSDQFYFAQAVDGEANKAYLFLCHKFYPDNMDEARELLETELKKDLPLKEFAAQ